MKHLRKIFLFLVISILLFSVYIGGETDFKNFVIENQKGWNLPDLSNWLKSSQKKVNIEKKIHIIEETYIPKENSNLDNIILQKIIQEGNMVNSSEFLYTYRIEYISFIKIYKNFPDSSIICYKYRCASSGENAELVFDETRLNKKSIEAQYKPSVIEEVELTSQIIFDSDEDGILESLYICAIPDGRYFKDDNELFISYLKEILKIKKENALNNNKLPKKLIELKKNWINYLNYPSEKNAMKVNLLLKNYKYKALEKMGNREKEMWLWWMQTLSVLKKEVLCSERFSVKIAMKLLPISIQMYSGGLDLTLDQFIRINPKMFLEEVKNHLDILNIEWLLTGDYGLGIILKSDLRYLNTKRKISSLKSVNKKELLKLRNKFINYLEEVALSLVARH